MDGNEASPGVREFPLHHLYCYLTEGCNLRCRHCWIVPDQIGTEGAPAELGLDLFRHVVEQARPLGLSTVKLTGGEPLIHSRIVEILEYIRDEDLHLTVETNGVSLSLELARLMFACRDPFVSVSLDGVCPETHEWVRSVKGCFKAALKGIEHLAAVGFRPQVIMTVLRRNRDEMEAVVRLAESLGAGSVKFNLVQPIARGERLHEAGETLPVEELVELGRWVETELSPSSEIPVVYSHPPAFRPMSAMFGDQGDGCNVCGILTVLGVLADGSYALCGIGENVPELVFGHATRDRLKDVWEETPLLRELREGLPDRLEGVCRDCLMKGRCRANCIAQNYYVEKNLWSPYWLCQQARELGLFPVSRLSPEADTA
ncbi:MAG: SynChlorMet cassette radical SAM/SPASM protein ScmF [Deltaproteobacteria bacterium]